MRPWWFAVRLLVVALAFPSFSPARADDCRIGAAVIGDTAQATPEISTDEMRRIVESGEALILDARPQREFALSHIPGARNVAARPGAPMSAYVPDVTEITQLVTDKSRPMVLYCNGPFCGKSSRLAAELLAAGFTRVRRYQLGIPVWRAFGELTEIERDGLKEVLASDRTAVVVDVRDPADFKAGTLPQSRNIPRGLVVEGKDAGEVRRAKDDGRLPMNDHNTRVIVVGRNGEDAEFVARMLTREAFHNVAYFAGTFEEARAALR